MLNVPRLLKYSLLGAGAAGTALSLHSNNYDPNAIGIVRVARTALCVADISVKYKFTLFGSKLDKNTDEYAELKSQCHQYGANRLLELCCANKGVYIKIGQHLGALDYILPEEYVQTLKVLHSRAPQNTLADVLKVIQDDFKVNPDILFKSIDPEPLGTASLAQVHKATLNDGRVVAIKIQHPYVRGNTNVDLKSLEFFVRIVSYVFPEFKFDWFVNLTKKNLPKELDFELEGRNAVKVKELFRNFSWLKVPDVYWEYTSPRVLTMEFVEGGQVDDLKFIRDEHIDSVDVTNKLGELYSQMIFIHGFVHSDPHPGNILLRKDNGKVQVVLLDHGLYADLSLNFRHIYSQLWLGILQRDQKAIQKSCVALGVDEKLYALFACMLTARSWDKILEGIDRAAQTQSEKSLMQKELPGLLPQITDVMESCNPEILLVMKTNELLRHVEHTLKTKQRMTSFLIMSKYCVKSVSRKEKMDANGLIERTWIKLSELMAIFQLNVYHFYMGVRSLQMYSTLKFILFG